MKPETDVQHKVVRIYRAVGCDVTVVRSHGKSHGRVLPRGFPDLVCLHPKIGLFFHETKTLRGRLSEAQLAFENKCAECHVRYVYGGIQAAYVLLWCERILGGGRTLADEMLKEPA